VTAAFILILSFELALVPLVQNNGCSKVAASKLFFHLFRLIDSKNKTLMLFRQIKNKKF
jgi:hypothetical protein